MKQRVARAYRNRGLLVVLLFWTAPLCSAIHISEFGALPDDGKSDTKQIYRAIQAAADRGATEIRFSAGVYDLIETVTVEGKGHRNYIDITDCEDLAIIGETASDGRPATRLARHIELNNYSAPYHHLSISESKHITIQNVVLANHPPLGSTARVVDVDQQEDEVTVAVLEGLPAYDGMRCASAHTWNLETGDLKRFGTTPSEGTLTIGLNIKAFWQAVPGTNARRLKMRGAGFSSKVEEGDGISWHHKATDSWNQVQVMHCEDLVFENVILPNVSNAGMFLAYNRNIILRNVRFEPENGNLAVGGRDGIHLSNSSGQLLIEDCYFKGLRMDPLVLRKTFGIVEEIPSNGSIISKPGYAIPPGDKIRFWVGNAPQDLVVDRVEAVHGGRWRYFFQEALPKGVKKGAAISFMTHMITKGVIRNCVFEGNFASAIVNFEENITVEDCIFRNNSYQIKYGANPVSGAFARNNIFRNNLCEDTGWIDIASRGQPATLLIHSLSNFFVDPQYNQHIEIYGNTFRNPHGTKDAVAIHVLNAEDVNIYNNTFEGFHRNVLVDSKTTDNIRISPSQGSAPMPAR
ncbi:MAG TPA: right-handed parallel beta-helix repeat-containing protein [Candidatus Brocadiia bacterium]|nr:right-handed parallel beta-helix repeat-containing protein [Candidatus Brocadiia bacterium]